MWNEVLKMAKESTADFIGAVVFLVLMFFGTWLLLLLEPVLVP
jgi:hypothetical protein